jgi:AcrR family transcriptional regulator
MQEDIIDQNTKEDKQRERILASSIKLFIEYGFKKLTVDEIANSIGLSKRTLYKYYSSKEELLKATMEYRQKQIFAMVSPIIRDNDLNTIEKITSLGELISTELADPPVKLLMDIETAMPDICSEFKDMRRQNLMHEFSYLYQEGMDTGYFRQDMNIDFVSEMYYQLMENMIHPNVEKRLKMHASEIYKCMSSILFEGLFTSKVRGMEE